MKQRMIFLSSVLLSLYACQPASQVQTDNAGTPASGPAFGAARLTETVSVGSEKDVAGLWAGRFDSTDLQRRLVQHMRTAATIDDYEFYEFGFIGTDDYQNLPAELRKGVEKDALYGGYYIAPTNKLSLIIETFGGGTATGRSVCAGNDRPLTGTYEASGDGWTMTLREPGDDPYDGVFTVSFRQHDTLMTGTWTPYKTTTSAKTFTLHRTNFTYNPDYQFNWPSRFGDAEDLNASARLLSEADVENEPKATLRIARTAIYARHGYSFKNRDIRNFFEGFMEYTPVTGADLRGQLTAIELKNEALLKRYEDYAEMYYDEYGR
ncbi:MAG: YARHG domain-containing protein [Bacteroidia bacterium]|nr:YARHG domain-containing protein [Bacteroidia bacterium]